jgi:hypothetical protein
MWWGPASENPIVMSNNAPGFPHFDMGLGKPTWIGVGYVETRVVYGSLVQSAYFDTSSARPHRFFAGVTIALQPRWLPGFSIGGTRVFYKESSRGVGLDDYTSLVTPFFKTAFQGATDSLTEANEGFRDQLASLMARWVMPESGFEGYVEWARNDHSLNLRDMVLEPEHSEAWTIGFAKIISSAAGRIRIHGEFTDLSRSETFQVRPDPTYYVAKTVDQGYTNDGRVIGAGIGPGSNGQFIGMDRYHRDGRWGIFLQRVTFNNDAYYTYFPKESFYGHEVEMTLGGSVFRFVRDWEVGGGLAITRGYNRNYVEGVDAFNFNLQMQLRYRR